MKKKNIMIKADHVSMRFNLGIDKGFSLKQWFVDIGKHKKKEKNCDHHIFSPSEWNRLKKHKLSYNGLLVHWMYCHF